MAKALLAAGVQPDLIICRSSEPVGEATRKKISNQCNIPTSRILSAHNVNNLFEVPQILAEQHVVGLLNGILRLQDLPKTPPNFLTLDDNLRSLADWKAFARQVDEANAAAPVVIAFVGKYNQGGNDAYQSIIAALHHAAVAVRRKMEVDWIDAVDLEDSENTAVVERLRKADGIFIPGGFGERGIEGKARAAGLARQWKKPYLGVCLGFQVAMIQFARDMLGLTDATSEEFDKEEKSSNHVVIYMPEISKETMGANMRLGSRYILFSNPSESFASGLYGGADRILERHRHRYEFNVKYKEAMESKGLIFSGQDESKERMDVIELPLTEHPFYLGVQFHPEYKSRPGQPSPPFYGFVSAACDPGGTKEMVDKCRCRGQMQHWTPLEI